jgi:hypothetical protein
MHDPITGAKGGGRVIDLEPETQVSSRALSRDCVMPRLSQVSSSKGARERTRWV